MIIYCCSGGRVVPLAGVLLCLGDWWAGGALEVEGWRRGGRDWARETTCWAGSAV